MSMGESFTVSVKHPGIPKPERLGSWPNDAAMWEAKRSLEQNPDSVATIRGDKSGWVRTLWRRGRAA